MTTKRASENFYDRTNFFPESLKKHFLAAAAYFWESAARRCRRCRPKLTGAPPPTQ